MMAVERVEITLYVRVKGKYDLTIEGTFPVRAMARGLVALGDDVYVSVADLRRALDALCERGNDG